MVSWASRGQATKSWPRCSILTNVYDKWDGETVKSRTLSCAVVAVWSFSDWDCFLSVAGLSFTFSFWQSAPVWIAELPGLTCVCFPLKTLLQTTTMDTCDNQLVTSISSPPVNLVAQYQPVNSITHIRTHHQLV